MTAAAWDLSPDRVPDAPRWGPGLVGGREASPSHRAPRPRLPARARRRLLVLGLAVGAGVVALGVIADGGPTAAEDSRVQGLADTTAQEGEVLRIVIAPGDTVWSIAEPHVPEGEDLHSYVAEIIAANEIEPSALQPGSVLDLPLLDGAGDPGATR
jgi:hypothetical protein